MACWAEGKMAKSFAVHWATAGPVNTDPYYAYNWALNSSEIFQLNQSLSFKRKSTYITFKEFLAIFSQFCSCPLSSFKSYILTAKDVSCATVMKNEEKKPFAMYLHP